ncbi:hypothetical protein [Bacillus cereus]|nr:hypothetical protein [Bacillus cereus]
MEQRVLPSYIIRYLNPEIHNKEDPLLSGDTYIYGEDKKDG